MISNMFISSFVCPAHILIVFCNIETRLRQEQEEQERKNREREEAEEKRNKERKVKPLLFICDWAVAFSWILSCKDHRAEESRTEHILWSDQPDQLQDWKISPGSSWERQVAAIHTLWWLTRSRQYGSDKHFPIAVEGWDWRETDQNLFDKYQPGS